MFPLKSVVGLQHSFSFLLYISIACSLLEIGLKIRRHIACEITEHVLQHSDDDKARTCPAAFNFRSCM